MRKPTCHLLYENKQSQNFGNQITDLPVQKGRLILVDSNIFVEDKKRHGRILTSLADKLGRYNLKLIIPRIVIYEVSKVTSTQSEIVLRKIQKIFRNYLTIENENEIIIESKKLETKYYEVHTADSIILATAKIAGAILVTMDRKLRRSAELEGVETYSLTDFTNNWRVIA